MATHFTVLGAGAWGISVALILAQNPEHRVRIWIHRRNTAPELMGRRESVAHLPGVNIPEQIKLTTDLADAVSDTDLLISAIPTVYLRQTLRPIAEQLPAQCPALSLSKGIEQQTFLRPSEILRELIGPRDLAVLSGPSHAEEVSRGLPTSVVVASDNLSLARWIQQAFSTDRFRVYTNLDLAGVELAGALKNIIGIAAGVADGLRLGDNAKAALLTRGLAEMSRFGIAQGAEPHTFFGLAGLGDLITTCMSKHGRNRHVGERLARGDTLQKILESMTMVAEGIYTTQSVHQRAAQMGISVPITDAVHKILYEGKSPSETVTELMLRTLKGEK
jgi:glycerol-3-phosphate dehydrogenase (NAD(P)+)